ASSRLGLTQVALAGVLWGTGGLALELVRDHVPMSVLTVSAWRMAIASAALVAVMAARQQWSPVAALLRERPRQAVLVGLFTAGYQALYFASVATVGVSVATVVSLGLAPVLLTVAEAVHRRRRPEAATYAVLVAAVAGLVLVGAASGAGDTGPHPVAGVLAALGSGTAFALTAALGRGLANRTTPLALTTTTTTVGAMALVPLALVGGGPLLTGSAATLGTLLYLGLVTMALAYALLYAGLRSVSGSAATIATLLEPVTAAVAAALVLGERLGVLGVLGTLLLLAAVAGLGGQDGATGR
ncbi:MAG: DMT family transporter, partial [Actinomycetota bacterium]|nr:DMT family transporter [Actinomycetota bacterium]